MPIRTPDGYLDITNATLRGSEIITTSKVGIANSAPTHTLSVGNKLFVDDSAANVLTVTGNLVATSLKIGQIDLAPSYALEHVANVGNTISNVVQFTNTGTGFVSASNVGIGTTTSPAGLFDVVGAFRMRYQDMGVTKAHIITGANSASIAESGGTYTYTRGGSGNTGNFLPNPSNIVPKVGQRYRVKLTARSDYAGTIRYECPTSTIITTYDLTATFKEYTWDFTATGTTMQFAVTTVSGTTSQFNAFSIERLGVGFNVNPTSTTAPVQISGVTHFSDNVGVGVANPVVKLDVSGIGRFMNNGGSLQLVGTDHTYLEYYPDGVSAGRKGYLGYASAADDNFTIRNDAGSGHILLSGGNVGIGTATVDAPLHIFKTAATASDVGPGIKLERWDNYGCGIWSQYHGAVDCMNFRVVSAATDAYGGTPQMVLTHQGRVGIGTNNPRWGFEATPTGGLGGILSCSNDPIFSHNLYYSGGWKYGTASTGGAYMRMIDSEIQFWNAPNSGSGTWDTAGGAATTTQRMTIDASGRVGIMTNNPLSTLEVGDGTSSTSGDAPGSISVSGTGATKSNGNKPGMYHRANIGLGLWSDAHMSFEVNGYQGNQTEAMRVTTAGNVGIGTNNPNVRLHVNSGDIGFEYGHAIKIATSNGSFTTWATNNTGTHTLLDVGWSNNTGTGDMVRLFSPGSQSASSRMALTSAGNVGINTETMIDSRNYGGLHLANSKGISFAASTNSGSRHWRIRTDDYSDHGSLQIGVSENNSTCPDSAGEVVMTMNRDRFVGIGSAYPTAPLEIFTGRNADTWSKGQSYFNVLHSANNGYGMSFAVSASHGDGMIQTYHVSSGNAQYDLRLQPSGGNVGVGTTNPVAKLHVNGTATPNIGNSDRRYFNRNTNMQTAYGSWPWGVSILASGTIVTMDWFVASLGTIGASDERIKKDIVDIDDGEALNTLRLLKPKQYKYKDTSRGLEPVWGFIAQEVKETLPYATQIRTECIPNIYEHANVSESNVITFTNFNTSNFESNVSTIKVYDKNDKQGLVTIDKIIDEHTIRVKEDLTNFSGSVDAEGNVITEITTTTITPEEYEALEDTDGYVANITGYQNANVSISVEAYNALEDTTGYEQIIQDYTKTITTYPGNQLFVYGQEVDDFVFLKKESIFTVATAALQEVDRQLQAEKTKTTALETKLQTETATLETKTTALETKLQEAEAKTAALETKLQEAEAKIATLQAEKAAIRSDLSSLVLRVTALES